MYRVSNITTRAFDMDGNRASFTNAERAAIIDIWRAVAEDFAPFDVDITTEDPGGWCLLAGTGLVYQLMNLAMPLSSAVNCQATCAVPGTSDVGTGTWS